MTQREKNLPTKAGDTGDMGGLDPLVRKICCRRKWQHTPALLPGKSKWTEEIRGLQSMGSQRFRHNLVTEHTHTHTHKIIIAAFSDAFLTKYLFSMKLLLSKEFTYF